MIQEDFEIDKNGLSNPVFSYNALSVPNINSDIVRIAMIQLAQSVALDFYLEKSQGLFDETLHLTNLLELYNSFSIGIYNTKKGLCFGIFLTKYWY